MRCEEIQERFVELLYDEPGMPPASPELRAHIVSCPTCSEELQELRAVRSALKEWKDEEPLRGIQFVVPASTQAAKTQRSSFLRIARIAAMAASVLLAFLALANAEVSWDGEGFSFKTHLLKPTLDSSMYYTRNEVRDLIKRVADDSEARLTEGNYLMIQRMLETLEHEQDRGIRMINNRLAQLRSRN